MSQTEVQLIKTDAVKTADIADDQVTIAKLNATGTASSTTFLRGDGSFAAAGQGKTRNLIINGSFNVAQRGTARSATTQGAGYATADRWKNQWNHLGVTATETVTALATSDSPYAEGHRKYLRFALTGAGTAASNSYIELNHIIESQNIATSGWNYTSSTNYVTLQFWFRCSTNQTFYAHLQSNDSTVQDYAFSFTASGNNTWTKITHTIPGNSNLVFNNDNGYGLTVRIIPFYGTGYTNNKTLNQWAAHSGSNYTPDMATTWLTAGASTFDIAAVQLEVGSNATDFEHRELGQELFLCERYYYRTVNDGATTNLLGLTIESSTLAAGGQPHPTRMRAIPTITFGSGVALYSSATGTKTFSLNQNRCGSSQLAVSVSLTGGTAGQSGSLFQNAADAYFELNAEL